jgi:ribonuclease HII
VATARSPVILVYRRAARGFASLREMLARNDFHAVVPPDALAEWECVDDRGTRVRSWAGTLLVEAEDDHRADEFDRAHRAGMPSDGDVPDGGDPPRRVRVIAGSDEAGKGERDRPLAVAAVAVPIDAEREALARGVRDSKLCTAGEIAELARWIRGKFVHVERVVEAGARAEALREHGGNETRLLAAMHAECVGEVARREEAVLLARVDRFAPNRPVGRACPDLIVDECVRGERHVACAAASVLARATSIGARHVPPSAPH